LHCNLSICCICNEVGESEEEQLMLACFLCTVRKSHTCAPTKQNTSPVFTPPPTHSKPSQLLKSKIKHFLVVVLLLFAALELVDELDDRVALHGLHVVQHLREVCE